MKFMTILMIVLAAFVAVIAGRLIYENNKVPALGVENGQLKPLSAKPNSVSTQASDAEKQVPTLPFKDSAETTINALKNAVAEYGGAEIKDEQPTYLYVVFTTSLMKYHDDAEFWLDTENQVVHFRSASRAGHSDMGLNRKRYERLTELYNGQ